MPKSRRYAFLQNSLLVIVSVTVGLFVGEVAVRVFAPPLALTVPWQDDVDGISAPTPGISGRQSLPGLFDVTVTINQQRFRGRQETSPQPRQGVLRIAALGDSFTWGYGAEDDATYPERLKMELDKRLRTNALPWSSVEVINAANVGTGTGEQSLWYERWVSRYSPHAIVLGVVSNDLADDASRNLFVPSVDGKYQPRPFAEIRAESELLRTTRQVVRDWIPGYSFLTQRSQLLAYIRNAVSAVLTGFRSANDGGQISRGAASDQSSKGVARFRDEIAWLARLAGERGTQMFVVLIPSRESVYDETTPYSLQLRRDWSAIVSAAREQCVALKISCADLTMAMRSAAKTSNQEIYFRGLDTHPNPTGNKIIGELTAALIAKTLAVH